MKTESKSLDNCQVKLTVTLDADEIKAIVKDVEKVFVREAKVPGFRQGKVPVELIRKDFASGIKEEVNRQMFHKYYADAVKAEKIDEIALMGIESVNYDDNGGQFVAVIDVKPVFKLPTYKGLKVSSKDTKVEESAVQEQLQRMRVAYAKYEDGKEGDVAQEGDFVQIDYQGFVDKKPILEINAEAKIVAEGKGFWTQIEEGRFLPEILDALKGMKAGESKKGVKAKFAKDAAPEGLKGAKATYEITLKAIRHRVLPTDEEFAKLAKAENIDKITATIRESLEKSAVEQEAARRENEAIEMLLKKASFDVPASQVSRATDNYLNELAQRAQYSGLDASYFEQNRDKILKDAQEMATKQVRLWYIIDAIATAEKIEAKDEEKGKKVMEFVLANVKK